MIQNEPMFTSSNLLPMTGLTPVQSAGVGPSSASARSELPDEESLRDAQLKETAQSFEAAFISQMLTFSGLGDAMTSGEGQMASAFTSFFLESLAEDMAEQGAFGLADKLYNALSEQAGLSDDKDTIIEGQSL